MAKRWHASSLDSVTGDTASTRVEPKIRTPAMVHTIDAEVAANHRSALCDHSQGVVKEPLRNPRTTHSYAAGASEVAFQRWHFNDPFALERVATSRLLVSSWVTFSP